MSTAVASRCRRKLEAPKNAISGAQFEQRLHRIPAYLQAGERQGGAYDTGTAHVSCAGDSIP